MARTKRMDEELRKRFLAALALDPNIVKAAEASGVQRRLAYRWRKSIPAFAEAWDEALELSLDDLEVSLMERALNGTERPIYQGGKQVGTERVFDNRTAEFILSRRRPEKWGDRSSVDVNVTVRLADRLEAAAARKRLASKGGEVIDV